MQQELEHQRQSRGAQDRASAVAGWILKIDITLFCWVFTLSSQAFEEWGDWPEDDEWNSDLETPV